MRSWSDGGINHLSTFDADLRNVSFASISFMGFPAILSTLQPFQMYIYNRKYSKLTFSNDYQLMGNRFMTNLHASLESTCKSRIPRLPPDVRTGGSIIFHYVQAKSELKNFRQDPGQMGGSIIFHHVQAKSELKKFRWDPGQMGGSIIFHYVQAKSELKNFRWDPGQVEGRSIIFNYVQAKSELKNFRWGPDQMGGQSSFTMSRLNLN